MTATERANTQLAPEAVGLVGAIMQALGNIAPALAVLFPLQFIATNAGIAAPLSYTGAFLIALMLGLVLAQFARRIPSVGTYYTFVSRSLGGRWGFLVAWLYLLVYITVLSTAGTFASFTLSSTVQAEYGWNIPWWVFQAYLIVVAAAFTYRGIRLSINVLVVLGVIEIAICLALGLWGFVNPGPGGVSLSVFNPGSAPGANGLFLGVIFAIFAFSGWDGAAPLAEESRQPRRTVPRAVIGSILIMGVLLLVTSWGQLVGWGTNNVSTLVASGELPGFVLAHRYWGSAWVLVVLAMISSITAAAIAINNVASRVFYGMARSGTMPSALAQLHPRFKTPTNAIWLQTGFNVLFGLGAPAVLGVANVFGVGGTMSTFAEIPVFIMANIGVYLLYRRAFRADFNPLLHLVLPIVASIALIFVAYESLNPLPAYPVSLAAPIAIAWLVIGVVVMFVMLSRRGETFLARAGQAMTDTDTAESASAPKPMP